MFAIAQHGVLAAPHVVPTWSWMALALAPLLLLVGLLLAALVSIIAAPMDFGMKIVWLVLVFALPFVGSVLWFLIGRGHARRTVAH